MASSEKESSTGSDSTLQSPLKVPPRNDEDIDEDDVSAINSLKRFTMVCETEGGRDNFRAISWTNRDGANACMGLHCKIRQFWLLAYKEISLGDWNISSIITAPCLH